MDYGVEAAGLQTCKAHVAVPRGKAAGFGLGVCNFPGAVFHNVWAGNNTSHASVKPVLGQVDVYGVDVFVCMLMHRHYIP